jgi:hypothetical protein
MADFDFYKATKRFILGEARQREPSMQGYLQSLEETLKNIGARSQTDSRRLEIAFEAIKGVKRHYRRLKQENVTLKEERDSLQEQLRVLEENKEE